MKQKVFFFYMSSVNTYIFTPACFSCGYLAAATATGHAGNKLAPSVHAATGFRELIHCSARDASHAGVQLAARKRATSFITPEPPLYCLLIDGLRTIGPAPCQDLKAPPGFTCASQERARLQIQ